MLVRGAELCRDFGFKIGIVTNCFWATTRENALLWLRPIAEIGIYDLSISRDEFHGSDEVPDYTANAEWAARELKIPMATICIDGPTIEEDQSHTAARGEPVVGGGVLFKGRAADKLTEGLPTRASKSFIECPHEELKEPGRIHVDPFGNAHICQGISMGNILKDGLRNVVERYDCNKHAICGPIIDGGPAELAERYDVEVQAAYVDECHMCFDTRRKLIGEYPEELAPAGVYGIE